MTIVLNLSLEVEAKLKEEATRQGKEISVIASELLTKVLEWEAWDREDAIAGIQKGLDDFEAGRFRSFDEFTQEQYRKHNLSNPE
ncbi:hypothetical protein [Spirulina sp. 06S082]|uniref:hypothetical protein n=1 Tax=Spirulina sp. 06S082 TaxID=3110248 RepID=UPI002B1ECBA4|nr:hypothetical protein [Spirulina sp. 06S082]MEA5471641.1 hypothetical protein [Spirulina sp. 06S082]